MLCSSRPIGGPAIFSARHAAALTGILTSSCFRLARIEQYVLYLCFLIFICWMSFIKNCHGSSIGGFPAPFAPPVSTICLNGFCEFCVKFCTLIFNENTQNTAIWVYHMAPCDFYAPMIFQANRGAKPCLNFKLGTCTYGEKWCLFCLRFKLYYLSMRILITLK